MKFESGESCGEVESLPEGTDLRGYWQKRDNDKEETARPGRETEGRALIGRSQEDFHTLNVRSTAQCIPVSSGNSNLLPLTSRHKKHLGSQ